MALSLYGKWKYATIGALAILALGFSFPQAFAHVSNNTSHMLQHIYETVAGINTKVDQLQVDIDNLTDDPAKQSAVEDAMFTQIVREHIHAPGSESVDCTSDDDYILYYTGYGNVGIDIHDDLPPFGVSANEFGTVTVGGNGGDTITLNISNGAGIITLQTTEGAQASCG